MSAPGSGSPTPTTATSGLEDPRAGADAIETAGGGTGDLRADREALADLIDPVDRTNPQGRRAGLSPLADAYSAADRILAARFRRVPEDAEPPESFEPGHVYEVTKRVTVNEQGTARFVDVPGGVAVGGFWSNSLSRVIDLGAGSVSGGGEQP